MTKCPKCGQEVEYFLKRKRRDPALKCPACNEYFIRSDLPPGTTYVVKYEDTGEQHQEQVPPQPPQPSPQPSPQPAPKRPPSLFEEPKEPSQVIAEILTDWGCDEEFVRKVCEYINMKGYFDPGWMMNMLLRARTGRRFTEQEAFMVVDMIMAALEREKRRAEEMGRTFPLALISLRATTPSYIGGAQPLYPTTYPAYPTAYAPSPTPTAPVQPPIPTTPQPTTPAPAFQPTYQPPTTPVPTTQQIQEMIRQALAEQRKESILDEFRKAIAEIEKKRIEDKAELEKTIAQRMEEVLKTVKETLAAVQPSQPVQPSPDVVTKKDLEILRSELEKTILQMRAESEKKELMGKIEGLTKEVEILKERASTPVVSPEGWQKDETRLIATLGTQALDIIRDRKPIEMLVRIVQQPPPQQQQKTEKSLVDLIKESGGVVE